MWLQIPTVNRITSTHELMEGDRQAKNINEPILGWEKEQWVRHGGKVTGQGRRRRAQTTPALRAGAFLAPLVMGLVKPKRGWSHHKEAGSEEKAPASPRASQGGALGSLPFLENH